MYDSKLEKDFSLLEPTLTRTSNVLPFTFYDADSTAFKAKADFYDYSSGIYIELKGKQCNTQPTIAKANANRDYHRFRVCSKHYESYYLEQRAVNLIRLNYDWNHSVYKHAIVSDTLIANGLKDRIVFFNLSKPLSYQFKKKLTELRLDYLLYP